MRTDELSATVTMTVSDLLQVIQMAALEAAQNAIRLRSEIEPRPSQVSQVQAAKMLGVSQPTVSRLVKSGIIKLNRCGQIPIAEIDEVLKDV